MSTRAVPMTQFDLLAGAKASYIEFFKCMGDKAPVPWEELTARRQELWVRVVRAGIYAAKETQARKVARRLLYRMASF